MRAIILAAGMGTRLRPLTKHIPKSLLKVGEEPIIERQIKFLQEKGILEIIIVTGYLKEKFEYLKEKYNVTLIHNDKYDVYNNVYSMYLVKDYLKDTIVTEADVFMTNNFFKTNLTNSTYFTGIKTDFKDEWVLHFDETNKVEDIMIGSGTDYIMTGVSYWSNVDGLFIKDKLVEVIENGQFKNLYWDDIVKDNLENLNIYVSKVNSDDWFEIDSIDDYEKVKNFIENIVE